MFRNKTFLLRLGIALSLLSGPVLADTPAPVVDLSREGYITEEPSANMALLPRVDASNLPLPERVDRVEQQINNLVQMDMPQQIAQLQQQVQQLSGQLQELAHQLDTASRQQQHVEALPTVPLNATPPPNPAVSNVASGDNAAGAAAPPSPSQTDAAAYEQAFSLLTNKQYDQSLVAFKEYLRRYPDGQFVANAHYWLGDIYFQQKNLTQAERELNLVITQYAASGKVADAQYKLAIIHAQQGNTEQARQELKAITARYPGSSAAQLASIQLQQLNTSAK